MAKREISNKALKAEAGSDKNIAERTLTPAGVEQIHFPPGSHIDALADPDICRKPPEAGDIAIYNSVRHNNRVIEMAVNMSLDVFEAHRCRRDRRIAKAGHRELIRGALDGLFVRSEYLGKTLKG